ncbi:sensor histidine kinase [Nonomuraea rubra]|uniref:histidine kinase n=2 Tax=Nonomuraea rubra TaxID=46180 RepID=A0A7X0U4D2_9ACTN|nr:histidine kinase [Nonomuraea rubra]MBB6554355.1 signal transduction histidine kinase [Nonomuraea rubra]
MLLVVTQVRATPAPGLTGAALAVTILTVALSLALLVPLLPPLRKRPPGSGSGTAHPHSPGGATPRRGTAWWKGIGALGRVPQPVMLISLGPAVVLSIALNSITRSGVTIGILLVCVSLAVSRLPLRQASAVGLLAVAGLVVAGELAGGPADVLPLVLSVCLIFLITYAAKQRKAARAAEAREAVLAERARIAREIHDILAHSLSAQLVHLEGAKLLLRAERTAEALDRVTHARNLAKSGLEEARRAVSALREDPPALPVALRTLAADFETTTHQPCTLRISGPEQRLTPETELALLRTAQEALTNIRRHAPGSPAHVALTFTPGHCDLRITNPTIRVDDTSGDLHDLDGMSGHAPDLTDTSSAARDLTDTRADTHGLKGAAGGGYGLMGMRERAELLGGTLTAGERDDGGFLVHLRVPA